MQHGRELVAAVVDREGLVIAEPCEAERFDA
jgi:hypothetical protein